MVKRIHIVLEDKEYEELKRIKEKLNLTWDQLLKKGAKCLEKQSNIQS